jgi:predicted TIM-barrel fold metal-dependent hydrolase
MTQFTEAPIFDADQHMYETPESLTKYLPEKYSRAVQLAQIGKQTRIVINNRVNDFIPNPTFERVAAPGAHEKFFAGENTEGLTLREMQGPAIEAPAATRNPVDRVAELDRQGVAEALNYPTLASLIEHATADDPELTLAIIHALNQWMLEHWTYNYENRVFSTPIINLSEVDGAQRELAYLLDNGVKVALIKPGPVNGIRGWRSPALPEFDPFWRDVEAAGLPIVLHASYPPLDDYVAKWEPPHTQNFMAQSAFRWMVLGHREISDMITSLICHGTLTRFPKLRIASVENGSAWIFPCSVTSKTSTRRCRRTSPSIRTTCSGATSGSARSGRAAWPTSSTPSAGTRCCSDRTTRTPKVSPSQRVSGSTPKAWTNDAPTTSWATTPAGSWVCRSPVPTRPPSIRQRWRAPSRRNCGQIANLR